MMYKVSKSEYLERRPAWMITLLLRLQPKLYGNFPTEHKAKVILRYIRMMIHKSRIIKQKGRLQLESSSDKIVIKNNFGRPYLSFNIEKTK